MKLPILQVAEALEQAHTEVNWFTNEVPTEFQTLPKLPVGRIVELDGRYTEYASADPNYFVTHVQVDLWCEDLKEVEKYYFEIDKTMRADNVQCVLSQQSYDPDLEGARRVIKRYTISQRVV